MARGAPKGNQNRKGKPLKHTQEIADKLAALGCDPITGMAEIAEEARATGDLALAGQMYKELAQYIAPKRKAIEHSGPGGSDIKTVSRIEIVPFGQS